MATTIVTKSGSGAPTASDLVAGELAVDLTNGRLYTENSGGTVLELGLNPNGNVDVTGSVTADGLSVIGDTGFNTGSPDAYAHIVPTDGELNDQFVGLRVSRSLGLKSAQYGTINQSGGSLTLNSTVTTGSASGSVRLLSSADGSTTKNLANFANNNDISFYEDTGTTPKFFWDASAESLGIGTDLPSQKLTLSNGTFQINGSSSFSGNVEIGRVDGDNNMAFATGGTERMRIPSSGGIDITNGSVAISGDNYVYSYSGGSSGQVRSGMKLEGSTNTLEFYTNSAEAMRIDASGDVSIGTSGGGARLRISGAASTSASIVQVGTLGYPAIDFRDPTFSQVGYILVTSNAVSLVSVSDQRLKENIADADDAGSKIDAIQVRKFDWKADGSHQDYGMVAQELLEVAPEAVSAPEDPEEMMGVDYSKLVPMMLKEIQSLRARIAALES